MVSLVPECEGPGAPSGEDVPDDDLKEDFWDHCATNGGNNLQGLAVQAGAFRA